METPMTRTFLLPIAALGAAFAFAAPAAADSAEQRALGLCRAELLASFPADSIRNHRVASINGNSRRTRITFAVNADRRYTFECAVESGGRIVTASFDPPRRDGQLVAGR
jgi:hypothetical protein